MALLLIILTFYLLGWWAIPVIILFSMAYALLCAARELNHRNKVYESKQTPHL